MSVGIKIYNENSQVLINSNYQNIAFSHSIDITNINSQTIDIGSKPVIVVEELLLTSQVAPFIAVIYKENYSINIQNPNKVTQKLFIFGEPDNSKITEKAGLIIYKNNSNEVAFDSRLKYLQVIGEIKNDMIIDPNRHYGIIRRIPKKQNFLSQNLGRKKGRYYYREKYWHEDYGIENDKIKIFDRVTRDYTNWFGDRAAPNLNVNYNIHYKPLLVDLTTVY